MILWTRRSQFWEHQPKIILLKSEKNKKISENSKVFKKIYGWKCLSGHVEIIFRNINPPAKIFSFKDRKNLKFQI